MSGRLVTGRFRDRRCRKWHNTLSGWLDHRYISLPVQCTCHPQGDQHRPWCKRRHGRECDGKLLRGRYRNEVTKVTQDLHPTPPVTMTISVTPVTIRQLNCLQRWLIAGHGCCCGMVDALAPRACLLRDEAAMHCQVGMPLGATRSCKQICQLGLNRLRARWATASGCKAGS